MHDLMQFLPVAMYMFAAVQAGKSPARENTCSVTYGLEFVRDMNALL